MLRQMNAPFGTHFISPPKVGTIGGTFGKSHYQHIHHQYSKNHPETIGIQRCTATVERAEYHIDSFDRKTERDNIHQIGKHRVTDRLTQTFGMSYRNILDYIHFVSSFLTVNCQRNALV